MRALDIANFSPQNTHSKNPYKFVSKNQHIGNHPVPIDVHTLTHAFSTEQFFLVSCVSNGNISKEKKTHLKFEEWYLLRNIYDKQKMNEDWMRKSARQQHKTIQIYLWQQQQCWAFVVDENKKTKTFHTHPHTNLKERENKEDD